MRPARILFIDDDPEALRALERIAYAQGWDAFTAASAEGAEALVDEHGVEVVVADHWMPQVSGIELMAKLRATRPRVGRILMTTSASREMTARAVEDGGVQAVLEKPWSLQTLLSTIKGAVAHARSLQVDAAPDARSAVKAFKR